LLDRICKGKGWEMETAAYTSQTRAQRRCTIWKVAAYWHLTIMQRIMWPSIAHAS